MADDMYLTPDWPAPPGVHAAATLRTGGVSTGPWASLNLATHVGDDAAAVARNRQRLADRLRLPSEPVWLEQVHGTNALQVDRESGVPADAAYTAQTGVVCAVLTADCLPVLLTDASGSVVAAVHAGWRGLLAGVVAECVRRVRPLAGGGSDWMAWLGPCIGPQHFEVGPEVRDAFVARDAANARAFRPGAGERYLADLPELARLELARCGIEAVFGGGICTCADSARFYSYRRDGQTGRMATLIWR